MKLSVHAPDADRRLAATVRDRFESGLRRYASIIREVSIRLRDENGPRGGRDQACLVRVALRGGREVCIHEQSETPLKAIGFSLRRLRRVIGEKINARARAPRRRRFRDSDDA